jgi:predicted lipoprotein with Yx(FWY)xxD motif
MLTACAQEPISSRGEDTPASSSPTGAGTDRPSSEPSISPSARTTEPGTKVIAAESDFGTILFSTAGQAIYLFDVEATTEPRCYGACADAWPPVLTDGAPLAGRGVKESLLGTAQRRDGTTQVTYRGHPLYFYAHEGKHEVKCHDVFLNGGNWYAVQPDGRPAP